MYDAPNHKPRPISAILLYKQSDVVVVEGKETILALAARLPVHAPTLDLIHSHSRSTPPPSSYIFHPLPHTALSSLTSPDSLNTLSSSFVEPVALTSSQSELSRNVFRPCSATTVARLLTVLCNHDIYTMAPALTHPTSVNFIDEQKPVNTDAATYYGGEEQFSRSRTYSAVRLSSHFPFDCSGSHLVVLRTWLQPQACTCFQRRLDSQIASYVPRREGDGSPAVLD